MDRAGQGDGGQCPTGAARAQGVAREGRQSPRKVGLGFVRTCYRAPAPRTRHIILNFSDFRPPSHVLFPFQHGNLETPTAGPATACLRRCVPWSSSRPADRGSCYPTPRGTTAERERPLNGGSSHHQLAQAASAPSRRLQPGRFPQHRPPLMCRWARQHHYASKSSPCNLAMRGTRARHSSDEGPSNSAIS